YEMKTRNLGVPSTAKRSPCTDRVCAPAGASVTSVSRTSTIDRMSVRAVMATTASYTRAGRNLDLVRTADSRGIAHQRAPTRALRFDGDLDEAGGPAAAETLTAVAGIIVGDHMQDVVAGLAELHVRCCLAAERGAAARLLLDGRLGLVEGDVPG